MIGNKIKKKIEINHLGCIFLHSTKLVTIYQINS